MKTILALTMLLFAILSAQAASTINAINRSAYGANCGWLDFRADGTNGAVIGEYVCSGNIYTANMGWINLGNGAPVNGIRYQNNSAADYGVNQDGQGNLRGYAYGANIGWVNFEDVGAPKIDLKTGVLTGYAYGANVGWISLSNAVAFVQTDTIAPGADLDHNGLPDAWELQYFGHTGVDPNADPDHDGVSNLQEYLAGTSPVDPNSALRMVANSVTFISGGQDIDTLTWESSPSRLYRVQMRTNLTAGAWLDTGSVFTPGAGPTTTVSILFGTPAVPHRFFRVEAVRPLMP
jgi:hypothetical protein